MGTSIEYSSNPPDEDIRVGHGRLPRMGSHPDGREGEVKNNRHRIRFRRWLESIYDCLLHNGVRDTFEFLLGHGVPKVLGIPILHYHRITDQLYIGPQHGNFGRRVLARGGLTGIVNLRLRFSDIEHGLSFGEYCHLSTLDGEAPTQEQFQEGIAFIRSVIANQGRVYIHCQTGLGRGPTMAAAFLISEGYSVEEALNLICSVRGFTRLTPPQFEALTDFERRSPKE